MSRPGTLLQPFSESAREFLVGLVCVLPPQPRTFQRNATFVESKRGAQPGAVLRELHIVRA